MSDWTVQLEFEEGTSSKFWRARVEGRTLYVNYGKSGSTGQTQVKDFPSPDLAEKEFDKLVREKRKKGYVDSGGGSAGDVDEDEVNDDVEPDDEDDDDVPAVTTPPRVAAPSRTAVPSRTAAPAPAPARPPGTRHVLESGSRKVETFIALDGNTVRMASNETYATAEAAQKAYERLKKMLAAEGYKES